MTSGLFHTFRRVALLAVSLAVSAQALAAPKVDPASFELVYEGRTLLNATPLPGNCPIDGGGPFENEMRESLLALAEAGGSIVGASVDCNWLAEVEDGLRDPFPYPMTYAATLFQAPNGKPWIPEQGRPEFVDILAKINAGEDGRVIVEDEEASSRRVADLWLERLGRDGLEVRDITALGVVGRDENAIYFAQIKEFSADGDRLLLATVSGATLINGVAVALKASTFVDGPQDLESVIEASKRYVQHLIDLNEGAQ